MKRLFANGCSFTSGDELSNLSERWSDRLPEYLDDTRSVTNFSKQGACNERIVLTTLRHFESLKLANVDLSDYIAVIQFSDPNRLGVLLENTHLTVSYGFVELCKKHTQYEKYEKTIFDYYKQRTDLQNWNQLYTDVISLSSYFVANDIQYCFLSLNTVEKDLDVLDKEQIDAINNCNWVYGTMWNSAMYNLDTHVSISDDNWHPMPESHKIVAQRVSEFINNGR